MKKIELLAPAGSMDSLIAAVNGGADAVYLSGKNFGARKHATNFEIEEIEEAVKYCHIRGVKVYVTVNILVADSEFKNLDLYVNKLYNLDVDAIIVQDVGVLRYLRRNYPDFQIHGSTQMTIHNTNGVQELEKLGVKRIVLGRELSIEQISEIRKNTTAEIEIFVHGAICISYSGQCLMSSLIGGRSGNRGNCAQPCRKKYKLKNINTNTYNSIKNSNYLLSPKDLSTLNKLDKVIESGVDSLKIEGRMKGPEYVFMVVSKYREKIDSYYNKEKISTDEDFLKIFNRGYSGGNIMGDSNGEKMSHDFPGNKGVFIGKVRSFDDKRNKLSILLCEDINVGDELQIRRDDGSIGCRVEHVFVNGEKRKIGEAFQLVEIPFRYPCKKGEDIFKTYDGEFFKKIQLEIKNSKNNIPVQVCIDIKVGKPIALTLKDEIGNEVNALGSINVEKALNVPLTREKIEKQVNKMGDSAYYPEKIGIVMDDDASIPLSEINGIRREAIMKLDILRETINKRDANNATRNELIDESYFNVELKPREIKLIASVQSISQMEKAIDGGIEEIYYGDINTFKDAENLVSKTDIKLYFKFNQITEDYENKKVIEFIKKNNIKNVVISNLGNIGDVIESDSVIISDYSFNIFNQEAMMYMMDKGVDGVTFSPELNLDQIEKFKNFKCEKELITFGYQDSMIMKYCILDSLNMCEDKKNCKLSSYSIEDEKGKAFSLVRYTCSKTAILNSSCVQLIEYIPQLIKYDVNRFRLDFHNESPDLVYDIVKLYSRYVLDDDYDRDFETQIKEKYNLNFTNGHINRGII